MNPDPAETSASSLVPPRPNLGPEPWPEPPDRLGPLGWSGLILATLLVVVGLWRWKKRRRSKATSQGPAEVAEGPADRERTPQGRLIASSEVVRGALIRAFGPGWGSKTTEEIAQEPALLDRFDPVEVGRLVALLRLADRVKFASIEPDGLDEWEESGRGLAAKLSGPVGVGKA